MADGPRVADKVAGCETLVSAVEEGEVVAFTHDNSDLLPLFLCRVDTSGVVGTRMQKDDGTGRCSAQSSNHAIKIETLGFGREIRVLSKGKADIGEDLVVVGPGWVGQVDRRTVGMETSEEEATQMDGARAGDGLERADAVFTNGGAVGTHDELLGGGGEAGEA